MLRFGHPKGVLASPDVLVQAGHRAGHGFARFDAPEAPGLDTVLRGLSMVADDHRVLELTGPIFDGLFEFFRHELLLGKEPS